jgi:sarcosine oxidase subunit alpha
LRHIGLAFVPSALSAVGSTFSIRISDGSTVTATVVRTPFYDPDNLRQKEGAWTPAENALAL